LAIQASKSIFNFISTDQRSEFILHSLNLLPVFLKPIREFSSREFSEHCANIVCQLVKDDPHHFALQVPISLLLLNFAKFSIHSQRTIIKTVKIICEQASDLDFLPSLSNLCSYFAHDDPIISSNAISSALLIILTTSNFDFSNEIIDQFCVTLLATNDPCSVTHLLKALNYIVQNQQACQIILKSDLHFFIILSQVTASSYFISIFEECFLLIRSIFQISEITNELKLFSIKIYPLIKQTLFNDLVLDSFKINALHCFYHCMNLTNISDLKEFIDIFTRFALNPQLYESICEIVSRFLTLKFWFNLHLFLL
jgi:hypothetical protein